MKKHVINIYGSCVSRDVFNYLTEEDNIVVGKYVGRISILSTRLAPVEIDSSVDLQGLPWEERMVWLDFTKKIWEYLDNHAEYIMLDFLDERFGLLVDGVTSRTMKGVTYSQVLQRSKRLQTLSEYSRISVPVDDDCMHECMGAVAEKLKSIFLERNIIINEVFPSMMYIDRDGEYRMFEKDIIEKALQLTDRLDNMYGQLKKLLPRATVVQQKHNVLADEKHKWGLAYMHFTEEYYRNTLERIREIID